MTVVLVSVFCTTISSCQWVRFCFFGLSKALWRLSSLPSKALFRFWCKLPPPPPLMRTPPRPLKIVETVSKRVAFLSYIVAVDEHLLWASAKSSLAAEDLLPCVVQDPVSEHLSHSCLLKWIFLKISFNKYRQHFTYFVDFLQATINIRTVNIAMAARSPESPAIMVIISWGCPSEVTLVTKTRI